MELPIIRESSLILFEDRFIEAFPGIEHYKELTSKKEIISGLDILLKDPLRFKSLPHNENVIFGDPIWWSRGIGDNPIDEYINSGNGEAIIDRHVYKPAWALAYRGTSRHQHFLYLEYLPQKPKIMPMDDYVKLMGIEDIRTEEVGLFQKKYFTRREFDDNYAIRRNKRIDISGAQLRIIHLTKYNMII